MSEQVNSVQHLERGLSRAVSNRKDLYVRLGGLVSVLVVVAAFVVYLWGPISAFYAAGVGYYAETLRIVVSVPLGSSTGQSIERAVQVAVREAGHRAGGFRIELVIEDTGNEHGAWGAEKEAAAARRAIKDPRVVAYIGPINSSAAKVSMPILNTAPLVQVSPTATWPGLTKIGFMPGEPGIFYPTGVRHFARVIPTDDIQGPAAAIWAYCHLLTVERPKFIDPLASTTRSACRLVSSSYRLT
jgi:ABC-type branched-subunit amino acid transport system substrate-binding protein